MGPNLIQIYTFVYPVKPTRIWQNYLQSVFQRELNYDEYFNYSDHPMVVQSLKKFDAKKFNWWIEFETAEDKLEFQLIYG